MNGEKHRQLKLWLGTVAAVIVGIIVLSVVAAYIPPQAKHLNRAVAFFTNFGAAAISATVAALFVVYQASKAHEDVERQLEAERKQILLQETYDNQLQQGLDYNRVRPMLYLIVKKYKHWIPSARIAPGEQVVVNSAGLGQQTPAEFVTNVNADKTQDIALLELRFFYGEPIHRIRVHFDRGTKMGGVLYIPYLVSNQRNIIITSDMLLNKAELEAAQAADKDALANHAKPPYAKPIGKIPLEETVSELMHGNVEIEFDTVLQEHVKVTFAYDPAKHCLDEGTITLSYNSAETTAFMQALIAGNKLPNEAHVTVPDFDPHATHFPMQKTSYTTVYTVPAGK